jgi:hypothetical protein
MQLAQGLNVVCSDDMLGWPTKIVCRGYHRLSSRSGTPMCTVISDSKRMEMFSFTERTPLLMVLYIIVNTRGSLCCIEKCYPMEGVT